MKPESKQESAEPRHRYVFRKPNGSYFITSGLYSREYADRRWVSKAGYTVLGVLAPAPVPMCKCCGKPL